MIKKFNQISKKDVGSAGGKGASLGEMTRSNFPVPDGFVILAGAFDKFLKETDLNFEIEAALNEVNLKKIHTIDDASEKIKAMILSREMPKEIGTEILKFHRKLNCKFVAVRSSATSEDSASAAWAGQLESYLNTTGKEILDNVKKCWASLFTPRAIFYRFEKGLGRDNISVAVVVQKMVESEKSGIAFSVHPVTQDENQLIIEAGFGLGEAIVSGSVTPDSYVFDKRRFEILDINVNNQTKALYKKTEGGNEWTKLGKKGQAQVLSVEEVIKLAKLIVKIENHYGFPVDVEWAQEQGKFYIVQSRPITTLSKDEPKAKPSVSKEKVFTKEHSREYSLFRLASWYDSMSDGLEKIVGRGVREACGVYLGGDLIHIYYEANDLKKVFEQIGRKCADVDYMKKEIGNFFVLFGKLKEYYVGRKKIVSIKDLRKVQEMYSLVWAYTSIVFIIPTLPVDETLKKIAQKAREKTQEHNESAEALFKKFLEKKYPILKEKTRFVFPREVWSGEINNPEFIEKLNERAGGFVYYKNKLYTGQSEKILCKLGIKTEDAKSIVSGRAELNKNQFKGQVAYKGKVSGKVKIITSHKQVPDFKKKEILVSAMTMPKYLPAMKKAGAFITDEGGVTCHAAIVSRELGIPCIVGTGNATQILKDGDLVEVDANEGVVRILERVK